MPSALSLTSWISLSWLLLGVGSTQASQEALLSEQHQSQAGLIESQQRPTPQSPETSVQSRLSSHLTKDDSKSARSERPVVRLDSDAIRPERLYSAGRRAEPRLWTLLNQGDYVKLDAEVRRLRREDPAWKPPAELLRWLRHHLETTTQPQTAPDLSASQRRALRYERDMAAAARLQNQGQSAQALTRLKRWEKRIRLTRDAGRLELLAWVRLDVGEVEQALADFRRSSAWRPSAEAARGELLALQQLGHQDELLAIAAPRVERWPSVRDTAIEVLRAAGANQYESGEYDDADRLLQAALALDASDRSTQRLMAWNDLERAHWQEAAARFMTLYHAQPDEDSARGLTLSLERSGARTELDTLAKNDSGPLNRLWRQERAREDYAAKRFVTAWRQDPESFSELAGIDSHSLLTGAGLVWRSGESGMARLQGRRLPILVQEHRAGAVSLQARIERVDLDTGSLSPGRLVGSPTQGSTTAYPFKPTTALSNGLIPELRIGYEGQLDWQVVLSQTPTQGERAARAHGALTLAHTGRDGAWSMMLEQRPIRESLLSYTGLRDPYTGETWGQVQRRGVGLQGWRPLTSGWTIAGQWHIHAYDGHDVASNHGFSTRASLGYDLDHPDFDYINLGPFIDYRHFDRNLSHFTHGHGGYYSPRNDMGLGLALNLQTKEGHPWLLKGGVYAGWRRQEQDTSPWFPLAPDGREYPAQNDSGLAAGFVLAGAWRLSPHWQLSGSAFIDRTPDFEQGGAMLLLRYQFEPRHVLVSDDLRASALLD